MSTHSKAETEQQRMDEFIKGLTQLSRRTGVIIRERYDSMCLDIETRESAQRSEYVVDYRPDGGLLGKYADLRWREEDTSDEDASAREQV